MSKLLLIIIIIVCVIDYIMWCRLVSYLYHMTFKTIILQMRLNTDMKP